MSFQNDQKCTHLLDKLNEIFVRTVLQTLQIQKLAQSNTHTHMLQSKWLSGCYKQLLCYAYSLKPCYKSLYMTN